MLHPETSRHLDDLDAVSVGIEDESPAAKRVLTRADGNLAEAAADFGDGFIHVVNVDADAHASAGAYLDLFALGMQADDDVSSIELGPVGLLDEKLKTENIPIKRDAALHVAYHDHDETKFAKHHSSSPGAHTAAADEIMVVRRDG